MLTSLKEIINEFETLCLAHDEIKTFEYGDFLDIIKSNQIEYTAAMLNCSQFTPDPENKTISYVFDLLVMDKTFKDNSNVVDVENQTALILSDLAMVINYSDRWQSLGIYNTPAPAFKYREKGADVVTGWGLSFIFNAIVETGLCDLPITGYDYEN